MSESAHVLIYETTYLKRTFYHYAGNVPALTSTIYLWISQSWIGLGGENVH